MLSEDYPGSVLPAASLYSRGVTLLELLLVVCLLGLLLYLALPLYRLQVLTGNRSLAVSELLAVSAQQERFFSVHRQYAANLADLGYPAADYAIDQQGEAVELADSGRIYRIELSTQAPGYIVSAIPQLVQVEDVRCRTLTIDAIGVRSITGMGELSKCW